jgi:hypothetical protein
MELDLFPPSFVPSDAVASTSTSSLRLLGRFASRVGGCEITGLPRKAQALIAYVAM